MLPLTDAIKPRVFPWVTIGLIAANVAFWLLYQLPAGLEESVDEIGFRACAVAGDCTEDTLPWALTATASMFAHGGWAHLVGNMLFLAAFGVRVEGRLGPARYLVLYVLSGYAATALQGGAELAWMTEQDTNIPGIGASGAISGVLGAYLVLFPFARMLTVLLPMFFLRVPALALLAVWFAIQALEGTYGLAHPESEFVGIAFFAHVGGFVAGVLLATLMAPESWPRSLLRQQRDEKEPAPV
jgi:membrane associated rhomboid family serine protease